MTFADACALASAVGAIASRVIERVDDRRAARVEARGTPAALRELERQGWQRHKDHARIDVDPDVPYAEPSAPETHGDRRARLVARVVGRLGYPSEAAALADPELDAKLDALLAVP